MSYEFIASPNNSSRKGASIDGVILHFTGGGDIEGTINWLCHPEANASCHYVISRSGRIVQLVKEDRTAWHAGSSTTTPKLNGRKNLNKWTIGIEICNWGWLYKPQQNELIEWKGKMIERKAGIEYVRNRCWTTPYIGEPSFGYIVEFKKSKALQYNKKYRNWPGGNIYSWEWYPEKQMESVRKLIAEIIERYPHITKEWIATHADVDPTRKLDMVGNVFDLQNVIDHVWKKQEEVIEFRIGRRTDDSASIEDMKDMYEPRNKEHKIWCF